jgi:hypothetical protein
MSKSIVLFIVVISAALPLRATGSVSDRNRNDYLVPSDAFIEPAYRKLLDRKLFGTRANYARITVFPSTVSRGEFTFAIHSISQSAALTRTAAASDLWHAASDANGVIAPDVEVKVTRVEKPFPHGTALLVSTAIERMLAKIKPTLNTGRIIVDGTLVVVSVEGGAEPSVEGALRPDANGRRSRALRRLADLLDAYCDAKKSGRPQLIRKIDATARQMLE